MLSPLRRAKTAVGGLVMAAWLAGCAAAGPTATAIATASPAPTGQGSDVAAMLIDPPSVYSRVPDGDGPDLGYISLSAILVHSPADRTQLTKDGFQFSYAREWQKPRMPLTIDISIAEYRDSAAATEIATYVATQDAADATKGGETVTPLTVAGIPGAFGMVAADTKHNRAEYLIAFSKGRYHCNVIVTSAITPVTVDDSPETIKALVAQLATAQYAKISA